MSFTSIWLICGPVVGAIAGYLIRKFEKSGKFNIDSKKIELTFDYFNAEGKPVREGAHTSLKFTKFKIHIKATNSSGEPKSISNLKLVGKVEDDEFSGIFDSGTIPPFFYLEAKQTDVKEFSGTINPSTEYFPAIFEISEIYIEYTIKGKRQRILFEENEIITTESNTWHRFVF